MNGANITDIRIRSERLRSERIGPSQEQSETSQGQKETYYIYVRIFLEDTSQGAELDNIDYVVYKLHPSFKNPLRRSDDRRSNFEIKIWTYGWFHISATIIPKQGLPMEIKGKVEFTPTPEEIATNGADEFRW